MEISDDTLKETIEFLEELLERKSECSHGRDYVHTHECSCNCCDQYDNLWRLIEKLKP